MKGPNLSLFIVILQPFKEELPLDFKCKDKFLVQTAPIHPSFDQQDIALMVRALYIVEKEGWGK